MSPPKFALSLLPLGDRTWACFCLDWSFHFLELKQLALQNCDSHQCAQDPSGVSVLPAERTRQHPSRRAEPGPALPWIVAENTRGDERPGANAKQRLRSATSRARLPGESVSVPQAHTRACQGTVIDLVLSERRHSALTPRWCPHLPRTGDPPERAGAQGERRRTGGGPPWQPPTRWVPAPAQSRPWALVRTHRTRAPAACASGLTAQRASLGWKTQASGTANWRATRSQRRFLEDLRGHSPAKGEASQAASGLRTMLTSGRSILPSFVSNRRSAPPGLAEGRRAAGNGSCAASQPLPSPPPSSSLSPLWSRHSLAPMMSSGENLPCSNPARTRGRSAGGGGVEHETRPESAQQGSRESRTVQGGVCQKVAPRVWASRVRVKTRRKSAGSALNVSILVFRLTVYVEGEKVFWLLSSSWAPAHWWTPLLQPGDWPESLGFWSPNLGVKV